MHPIIHIIGVLEPLSRIVNHLRLSLSKAINSLNNSPNDLLLIV